MDRWNQLPEEQQFAYGVGAQGLALLGTIGTLYSQTGSKYADSFNDNRNYVRRQHGGMDVDTLGKRYRPDSSPLRPVNPGRLRGPIELGPSPPIINIREPPVIVRQHPAWVPKWEALEQSLAQDALLDAIVSDRPQITRARLIRRLPYPWKYRGATGYARFGRRKSRRSRFRRRRRYRPRRRFSRRRRFRR